MATWRLLTLVYVQLADDAPEAPGTLTPVVDTDAVILTSRDTSRIDTRAAVLSEQTARRTHARIAPVCVSAVVFTHARMTCTLVYIRLTEYSLKTSSTVTPSATAVTSIEAVRHTLDICASPAVGVESAVSRTDALVAAECVVTSVLTVVPG